MVFGDCTIDGFKEIYLEDELSLQLGLLKKDMPDSYLFPAITDVIANKIKSNDDSNSMDILEELVEDGALESLAMCGMIFLVMMAPQLF